MLPSGDVDTHVQPRLVSEWISTLPDAYDELEAQSLRSSPTSSSGRCDVSLCRPGPSVPDPYFATAYEELRKENLILRAKLETWQYAFQILAQSTQPRQPFMNPETPLLESSCPPASGSGLLRVHGNSPDFKSCYTRSEWTAASEDAIISSDHMTTSGGGRSVKGENVTMSCIEHIQLGPSAEEDQACPT